MLSFEDDQLKLQSTVALPAAPLDVTCDNQDKVWLALDAETEGQTHAVCFGWDGSSNIFRAVSEEEEPSLRSLNRMQKEFNLTSTKQLPFHWQDKVLRKFCFPDAEELEENVSKKSRR